MSWVFRPSRYPGESMVVDWTNVDAAVQKSPFFLTFEDFENIQMMCALEANSRKGIQGRRDNSND